MARIEQLESTDDSREELKCLRHKEQSLLDLIIKLQEKENLLQEKENLLLGSSGTAVAGISAAVQDAVDRAFKKQRCSEASISEASISDMNESRWQPLAHAARLVLTPWQLVLDDVDDAVLPQVPAFQWSAEEESQQADRYLPYLQDTMQMPQRTEWPLMWLDCGKKVPTLLDISGFEDVLAYSKVKGNTDVAIITRVSYQLRMEACGLAILFELKKPSRIKERSQLYKAATRLVVANLKTPHLKPVVVLTDLNDVWRLFWLEEGKLMVGECISRAQAVTVVRGCIQQAAELAVGPHAQGLPALQGQLLPERLSQRMEASRGWGRSRGSGR